MRGHALAWSSGAVVGSVVLAASSAFACVSPVEVRVTDFAFTPRSANVPRGGSVAWRFDGPSPHTATSGMGLFDSGVLGTGASYQFKFLVAGKYPYQCDLHASKMTGVVAVPMQASPASGTTATRFTVTWAKERVPSGHVADIQIKRPGSTAFVNWKVGTTALSSTFTADRTGVHSFRARLRNVSTAKSSSYSATSSISVG